MKILQRKGSFPFIRGGSQRKGKGGLLFWLRDQNAGTSPPSKWSLIYFFTFSLWKIFTNFL